MDSIRSESEKSKVREYVTLIGQRTRLLLNELLLPYDITSQQARIIGFVISEQRLGRVICQKDIEEAFELKGSSITSLLQGLERKHFIIRRPDPADERRKVVTILPKGQDLMSEFETAFDEMDERLVRDLAPEQMRELVQMLERIMHNLD